MLNQLLNGSSIDLKNINNNILIFKLVAAAVMSVAGLYAGSNMCDTTDTHFKGITDNIYDFGRLNFYFCAPFFFPSINIPTRPKQVLPIQVPSGRVSALSYG